MGTIGLSPDRALMERTIAREQAAIDRGGFALPPDPTDAVPSDPAIAAEALRTIPPRETAGNVDIKQLGKGAKLYIPVYAAGGLFSAGDAHFAQGDNETCGTAIEMRSTLTVRFAVHKGRAAARGIQDLQFARDDYYLPPEFAAPRRFFATTGLSVTRDGESRPEDLTLAARNALLNMIDHLQDHGGWTRQQAYAICSVAVDLKVSEVVDVPSFVVSAFLPLDIFEFPDPCGEPGSHRHSRAPVPWSGLGVAAGLGAEHGDQPLGDRLGRELLLADGAVHRLQVGGVEHGQEPSSMARWSDQPCSARTWPIACWPASAASSRRWRPATGGS